MRWEEGADGVWGTLVGKSLEGTWTKVAQAFDGDDRVSSDHTGLESLLTKSEE
jgi:hypothetical protein